jgi:ubiquinone/menaquinone biosynthesis C-methylase UbiE
MPFKTYSKINKFIIQSSRLNNNKPHTFADFGCGLGMPTKEISKKYKKNKFILVNINKEQINCIKKTKNIYLLNEDYHNTSISSNSVDTILFYESFCHSYDKKLALDECYRVLKRNGRLIIIDYLHYDSATEEQINSYVKTMSMYLITKKQMKKIINKKKFKIIIFDTNINNYFKLKNSKYDDNYIYYKNKKNNSPVLSDFGEMIKDVALTQAFIALPSIIVLEKI